MNSSGGVSYFEVLWAWIVSDVFSFDNIMQYILIVICFIIAYFINRKVRKKLPLTQNQRQSYHLKYLAKRILRRISFPITLFLLFGLIVLGYRIIDVYPVILGIATTLILAWTVIRFGSAFISNSLLSRFVSTIVWIIAALHLTGYLLTATTFLDSIHFSNSENSLSLLDIISSVLAIAAFLWVALFLSKSLERLIQSNTEMSLSARALLAKISKFALVMIAVMAALQAVGINLTALAVFGGAIGIGIGLGLQQIFSNVIAGIILLVDKSIKPGDTIIISGRYGKVDKLSARYVSVITRDGTEHLVPNEDLINNQVENWSYSNKKVRMKVPIGVHYNANVPVAIQLCIESAEETLRILKNPSPVCLLKGFGDSSIDLELRFWIADPMNGCSNVKSLVLLKIWEKFKQHNIEIPYPQRDIHIKGDNTSPIAETLEKTETL